MQQARLEAGKRGALEDLANSVIRVERNRALSSEKVLFGLAVAVRVDGGRERNARPRNFQRHHRILRFGCWAGTGLGLHHRATTLALQNAARPGQLVRPQRTSGDSAAVDAVCAGESVDDDSGGSGTHGFSNVFLFVDLTDLTKKARLCLFVLKPVGLFV